MTLKIAQIFIFIVSCMGSQPEDVTGKYFTDTGESYIDIINIDDKGIIYGVHCFVYLNGERIDCCIDDGVSIQLQRKDKSEYEGTLSSCYDGFKYDVLISFKDESLNLVFKEKHHPFMAKELTLKKEN